MPINIPEGLVERKSKTPILQSTWGPYRRSSEGSDQRGRWSLRGTKPQGAKLLVGDWFGVGILLRKTLSKYLPFKFLLVFTSESAFLSNAADNGDVHRREDTLLFLWQHAPESICYTYICNQEINLQSSFPVLEGPKSERLSNRATRTIWITQADQALWVPAYHQQKHTRHRRGSVLMLGNLEEEGKLILSCFPMEIINLLDLFSSWTNEQKSHW